MTPTGDRIDDTADTTPPWERHGAVRRDCDPHRGNLLATLGAVSLASAILGPFSWGLMSVPALALGVAVWWMAERDLARMTQGRVDPAGEGSTRAGRALGVAGTVIGLAGFLCFGFLVLGYVAHEVRLRGTT